MKRKASVDTRDLSRRVTDMFHARRADGSPMTGKERREAFLQLLAEWQKNISPDGFAINRKGCFIERLDRDLRCLIKSGKVIRHRVCRGFGTNHSYVRLPAGVN